MSWNDAILPQFPRAKWKREGSRDYSFSPNRRHAEILRRGEFIRIFIFYTYRLISLTIYILIYPFQYLSILHPIEQTM